jgi:hypothetical protein
MERISKNYFSNLLITIVVITLGFGCQQEDIFVNPFTNVSTLDCRNLIIRNVSLNENLIEVTLENTCKSCEDGWVYLGMVMIDKTTNKRDTLAQTDCLTCFSCPKNGKSEKYQLTTKLTTLPDLKSVQFNFGYLCTDLTYLKK